MFQIKKYLLLGLSVILMMVLFAYFSDEANIDYDYKGIVYDIRMTTNGCIFDIECQDGDIHCYSTEIPALNGYYGITGSLSDDGDIFFVEKLVLLEQYL